MKKIRQSLRRAWHAFKRWIADPGLDVIIGGVGTNTIALATVSVFAAVLAFGAGNVIAGVLLTLAVLSVLLIGFHTMVRLVALMRIETMSMNMSSLFAKMTQPA